MARLIKLYRKFEIKWDKDRGYVVISPSGKLIRSGLESTSAAQRYVERLTGGASTPSKSAPPKSKHPEPRRRDKPPAPCERCGAEHTSLTAFRKDGLCGPCWITTRTSN